MLTFIRCVHFDVLIGGAGTAGLSASARIKFLMPKLNIGIVDKSKFHHYQPAWTLASVNLTSFDKNTKILKSIIPKGVHLIEENISTFNVKENNVILDNNEKINYDFLIVACGLEMNYDSIPGIEQALINDDSVFTIFDNKYNRKSYNALNAYDGNGPAVFSYPMNESFKCRGAAAKILFLADDLFKKNNIKNRKSIFISPKDYLFSVPRYNKHLEKIAHERKLNLMYGTELKSIDSSNKELNLLDHSNGKMKKMKYTLLHFTPEMRTPYALRACSDLVDNDKFVEVDARTLQHVRYNNVFSCGDCSNVPTSKTAAAISEQLRTLIPNLMMTMKSGSPLPTYSGYTACPLACGSNKLVLAEFGFDKKPLETFPVDQSIPRYSMFMLKKYAMPWIYWNLFIKGKWYGPSVWQRNMNKFQFWKTIE